MAGQRTEHMTDRFLGQTSRRQILTSAMSATAATSLGLATSVAAAGNVTHHTREQHISRTTQTGVIESGAHVQAVVSAHWMATEAGLEMLAAGGTAADAAVAVASVLTVVEPWFSSALGGGAWGLYFDAETSAVTSLDGVGPVGSKATIEDYRERAGEAGMHQANVPGSWDAWMRWLDRYGRLDLGLVLAPAIRIAQNGYPVSAEMASWLEREAEAILGHVYTARIYAPEGSIPVSGDVISQTDLADTFTALAGAYDSVTSGVRSDAIQAARDYYYRGPLADAIVSASDQDNGYFTLEDFAAFEAEIVESISIEYGETTAVYQSPPNSQGITMLLALNILKGIDHSGLEPHHPDVVHSQVEALKLAFGDRHDYIGDPDRSEIPLDDLLSDTHAAEQLLRIDMSTAMVWPAEAPVSQLAPTHTSTFQIVDSFGNAATVTTSLGAQFLVIGETGIHINERNRFFSLDDGSPNLFGPGSKVRHTSCPYMVLRDGRPYVLGGNTGVDTQPQAQLQQLMSAIDFDLTPQEAINLPRFVSTAFPATKYPYDIGNTLQLEEGFPDSLIAELEARGHAIVVGEGIFGSAGMILVNDDGTDAQIGIETRTTTSFGQVIAPGS